MKKEIHNFAPDLTMPTSIKVFFIAAAFLLPAYQNSTGCSFSSGSRCKALLTLANIREEQSLLFLKHFYPTMPTSVKKCSTGNNSTLNRTAHETRKELLEKRKSSLIITLSITGLGNNRWGYVVKKAIFRYFVEKSRGHLYAELRLKRTIELADELLRDDMKELIGKTVIIK